MKSIFTTFLILSFTLIKAQNVGINNANLTPDPSAGLDVNYTDKGVLIPRVALTGTNDVTTVPGAATSLLVYNTATVNDVTPGYYYWDGTQWLRLLNTGNAGGMEWLLTGNAGTTAGTNFLGTTDAQDLVFKTNNTENMRITNTNGYVGIGTPSPTTTLQLNNNIYFDEGNGNIAVNPDIRFDLQGLISADNNLYLNFDGTNNSGTQALYIGYASQTSSATNAMTILDNGNTGIGTTTPTSKLQVVDRYDTTQTLTPFNSLSDRLPGVSVYDNTDFIGITTVDKDNNLSTTNDADGMIYWGDDNNDQDLRFTFMRWNGTRLVPTDHMAIKANGNVGIGISTPGIRLQVDDSSSATTYIGVSGKLSGNSCVGYRWINRNPSEGSWTAYFGGPVGFSGVQPRAWEIWEYPNDGNYCCRTRFRIQSTYGLAWTSSLVPVYIDVNNQLWAYGYNTISDENLKENIKNFDLNVLDKILNIKIYNYNYKNFNSLKIGFIAQEIEKIFPEIVNETTISEKNGEDWIYNKKIKGIDYSAFSPLIIKAIQEQQQIIDDNTKEIQLLVKQNEELKKQLEELKKLIIEKQ